MKRILSLLCVWLCVYGAWQPCASTQPPQPNTPGQAQPQSLEALLRACQRQLDNERYELAYQTARQALALSERFGDKRRQMRATRLLATAAFHTNRTSEAIRYFKQSSAAAEEAGVIQGQGVALSRAGMLLRLSGRYEDALFCFNEALRFYQRQRNRMGEALMLSQIGGIYADTADYAKATQILQEALNLAHTLADPEPRATILARLIAVEKGRGNLSSALQYGEQAEALLAGRPPTLRNLELLYQIGAAHAALDQPKQAAERFEQALRLARELRAPQFAAIILGDYAGLQLKSGNAAAAFDSAAQAVALLNRGGGSKHQEAQFLATGAEAQRALGRNDKALAGYRLALAALEQARARSIPTEISRAGIVATRQQVFAGAIDLLLSLGRPEEAFDVAEAYHARAFLDVLAESAIDDLAELNPAQQAREDQLFEQISAIQKKLWQPDIPVEQEERLKGELAEAENALELFRLELRRADPRYAGIKAPQPLSHRRVAAELLDAGTALVEYVLGDKQSFAWVIFQGKISSVKLPSGKELTTAVAAYRAASSSKVSSQSAAQAIAKLRAQNQQLYQKLFQPLEPHLASARKLIIVPDGALAYLPFETLVGEPKRSATTAPYLIERFAISYAPSASALAALRALRQSDTAEAKGIIAFGDPVYGKDETATANGDATERGFDFRQLPYTRAEVNEIAALFSPTERRVFLGAAAREQNVKAEPLSQYRYVHFATHALIDEEHPARSGIMLSAPTAINADSKEDGALQMSEVMRLKLNADLVTLSACRTGLGQLLKGEGMIGLTRAFLYAGAESVVVSLWNVNDIATATLMKAFYKNLKQGLSKDAALRQAKLEMIRGRQQAWRHPYYWAAFVIVGDPR
ncbi:MAG: CHAT domain-containing protein [Blastocatellales bacterium]